MKVDLNAIFKELIYHKIIIIKFICIGIVLGGIIVFSLPKTYSVTIKLSPESTQNGGNNNLAGMASMLGIGGIGGNNQDAVNSTMIPDLIKSTPFILEMYNIEVSPLKSEFAVPLSEYIETHKKPWWSYVFTFPEKVISGIISLFSNEAPKEKNKTIDPYRLTGDQYNKINTIRSALSATEDKKSGMTIITATFQDPEVAATVADSAVIKLQEYIIEYRIRKAQEDCDYLEKLCKERKEEYHKAQKAYANFMDTNRNVVLQRTQTEGTRLQNDMSIAFQIYSQVETQLQIARAKVQEAKPVFAVVEPATIPLNPSSPNKKVIIPLFIFLGIAGSCFWILFGKDLWNKLNNIKQN